MPKTSFPLLGLIALLVILGVGGYVVAKKRVRVDQDKRQAVFLSNGDSYFGDIVSINEEFIALKDVYYPPSRDSLSQDSTTGKKKLTLQKLNDAIYGPDNTIYINREQVLYFGDMRANSKVNEAIEKYIQESNATPHPTVSPAVSPSS
jgi:hypothetical protein